MNVLRTANKTLEKKLNSGGTSQMNNTSMLSSTEQNWFMAEHRVQDLEAALKACSTQLE